MAKKLIPFFIALFFAIEARSQVDPTIGFVKYVSFTDTMNSVSSAIDGSSKVYTTGRITNATQDIIVQCTDSTGVILWTYTYNNGGYDSPNKIHIDAFGNSYIVGTSSGSTTNHDYIILKLNSSGTLVWSKRFDGGVSGGGIDEALDVCIDAGGYVYVTGKSKNSSGFFNAVTLKLAASTGNIIWQHSYTGTGLDNIGVCMTLAGNQSYVVIGANSNNASTNTNIIAYRLTTSAGGLGWSYSINGTANGVDNINSIILAGGNVVLAGMLTNTGNGTDYVVSKINVSSGGNVFQKMYNFGNSDVATSLVRDSTDNLVVTGTTYNSSTGTYEYHTIFYDSLGGSHWVHKKAINASSLDVIPLVVCDTIANHFYVVGEVQNANRDVMVYQLTPGGNVGWQKNFNAPANGLDVATGVVINGIGVLFVCANTTNLAGKFDLTTIKIAQTPVYFPFDLGTTELNDNNFVFQENKGQLLHTDGSSVSSSEVRYYNQGCSPSYYFSNTRVSQILIDKDKMPDSLVRVDFRISNANPLADMYSYNPIDAKKNYFITSPLGITDVMSYQRLFVPEIIQNVDVHYYSNSKGLKTYFVFKVPGENIAAMKLVVEGATSTSIDGSGHLIAATSLGNINMGSLHAYQESYNPSTNVFTQTPLTVSWNSLGSSSYNFVVSGYSTFWPVVVYLSKPGATSATGGTNNNNLYWSTFVGGQGSDDLIQSRVDAKDNYYAAGNTVAPLFPGSSGGFQNLPANAAANEFGILSKFRSDGKLLFSTYYGGATVYSGCGTPAVTEIQDVTVDSLYNIYIVGETTSKSLITKTVSTPGALNQTANASISGVCQNAYIAKLNPTGNVLHLGSYYGGTNEEKLTSIRYNGGQIKMAGYSSSTSIPLVTPQPNTYQITSGGGMYLHWDTAGAVKHSTKLQQGIVDADIDKRGNFYMVSSVITGVGGGALPIRAPATTYYTAAINGPYWDWGIQRFTPADSLNWSTNFGGSSNDFVTGVCIRDSIMAISGYGTSSNFPFYTSPGDSGDITLSNDDEIQLAKFDIRTGKRVWCALFATPNVDHASAITLDRDFNLYVTGNINCSTYGTLNCSAQGFKILNEFGYYSQNYKIDFDAFLLGYNSKNQRRWTTYFGSLLATTGQPNYDAAQNIAVNSKRKLFISGQTDGTNSSLPTARWNTACYYDSLISTGFDGFISMFDVSNFSILTGVKDNGAISLGDDALLFPNPNSGIFTLRLKETTDQVYNLSILNILGQKVYEKENVKSNAGDLDLNLCHLNKGVYFITLNENDRIKTIKFIIQ